MQVLPGEGVFLDFCSPVELREPSFELESDTDSRRMCFGPVDPFSVVHLNALLDTFFDALVDTVLDALLNVVFNVFSDADLGVFLDAFLNTFLDVL
ncbi:unnamed protein product [Somion occarium]|uniref:Uncharacterized protein n=1 Tax=Somion occarium TaxID=3059160 RepID=A0ABP1DS62_9APHY